MTNIGGHKTRQGTKTGKMTDYQFYLAELTPNSYPKFLEKYLKCPSLLRLKNVGYFCGMDYASPAMYHFSEYISRFDHSLTTALLTASFTSDPASILAALFHDVATPCFSHAIDFMNQDYDNQESTEAYTLRILSSDSRLAQCLAEDDLSLDEVADFKRHPLVDNERPRLCADRLDGLILSGIGWAQDLPREAIRELVENAAVYQNEDDLPEIGFRTCSAGEKALAAAKSLDAACNDPEDIFMMELLACIARRAIEREYIIYDDLYTYGEKELLDLLHQKPDPELARLLHDFTTITPAELPDHPLPHIKSRKLNPLVAGERLIKP